MSDDIKIIDNGNHTPDQKELMIEALNLALKYGAPAVIKMIQEWKKTGPISIDDVKNLEFNFKDPSLYFK